MFFQLHLVARVDRSVSCQQQRHDVHVALLRRQMQRGDALPRHAVGGCAVFQQRGGNLQLVLLGSDVQRRVAVLGPRAYNFNRLTLDQNVTISDLS